MSFSHVWQWLNGWIIPFVCKTDSVSLWNMYKTNTRHVNSLRLTFPSFCSFVYACVLFSVFCSFKLNLLFYIELNLISHTINHVSIVSNHFQGISNCHISCIWNCLGINKIPELPLLERNPFFLRLSFKWREFRQVWELNWWAYSVKNKMDLYLILFCLNWS